MKQELKNDPDLAGRQVMANPRRPARCSNAPGSLKHSLPHRERALGILLKRTAPPNAAAHRLVLDRTPGARLGRRLRRWLQRLQGYWSTLLSSVGEITPLSNHFGTRFLQAAGPRRKQTQPGRDANN